MAHEIDTAQALSLGGFFRRRAEHALPPGTPCANCGAALLGPWCYVCGQLGEDFHRSWFRLLGESVEGVLHLDGRIWRTVIGLALRPGQLTRSYLEGHRVPQIPPLRLFLVVLLLVFTVGALASGKPSVMELNASNPGKTTFKANTIQDLTPAQKEQVKAGIRSMRFRLGKSDRGQFQSWMSERAQRVVDNPELFSLVLETWAERFAFLMLPLSALLLSLLFIFQRRFYLFDHLIFSLHSLSFFGLFVTAYMLVQSAGRMVSSHAEDVTGWLIFILPIHLFAHMRGVYATSIFGTLLRMALLFVGSVFGFAALMAGLLFVGLANV